MRAYDEESAYVIDPETGLRIYAPTLGQGAQQDYYALSTQGGEQAYTAPTMQQALGAQRDALGAQRSYARQQYEAALERLKNAQYGMTTSEKLAKLSQALLSPSPYRNKTKGTLANLAAIGPELMGDRRKADLARAEAQRALTEKYMEQQLGFGKSAADMMLAQAQAMAPKYQLGGERKDTWMAMPQPGVSSPAYSIDAGTGLPIVQSLDQLRSLPKGARAVFISPTGARQQVQNND